MPAHDLASAALSWPRRVGTRMSSGVQSDYWRRNGSAVGGQASALRQLDTPHAAGICSAHPQRDPGLRHRSLIYRRTAELQSAWRETARARHPGP